MSENNINNSNKDFQDINSCDFNKHWSWSILFKNLAILEQVNKLNEGDLVVEVGAANSYLKDYMINNTKKKLQWIKQDVNEYQEVEKKDILEGICFEHQVDMIIMSEVIEHLPKKSNAEEAILVCYSSLKKEGILVLTTPTPGEYEDKVWPNDHKYEFEINEIYTILNKYFFINSTMPWSLHERDYNDTLIDNNLCKDIYMNLREKMPKSFIRALISLFSNYKEARQILMICKKRRLINGKF